MGLFWLLLIGFAAYLIYLNLHNSHVQGQGEILEAPLEIAKKRLARGDITREQFEEIKRHLE
jgi:putative membrane protein